MVDIGIIMGLVLALGGWLKSRFWFPNSMIPLAILISSVILNVMNAYLFGDGNLLEAGKLAFIHAVSAIGIHSGIKNSFQKRE